MSSICGFRKGEIDGKSFLIFSLLNPFSSSSGDNDLLQPLFIFPRLRYIAEKLKQKESGTGARAPIPLSISPNFPTTRSGDQLVRDLLNFESHNDICKLPVVPLFWCNNKEPDPREFDCRPCQTSYHGTNYYFCPTCRGKFHKECVETLFEIKYPSYAFLSLKLSYYEEHRLICDRRKEPTFGIGYHRPTSRFSMHPVCALKPIPFVIDHPKRHLHPLTFFPKQAYLPCYVCGLIIESIPTYLCVPCIFVVHQDCVYFPNVIKISRHSQHRIIFTSSLPSGDWFCGVCRKEVDNNCGAYSCNKCDGYFVHTRCALRRDLWDGVELDEVPEEPEIVVPPFERISNGIILHFSHGHHHLKLEISRVYDKDKFCQVCVLPIYEGYFYSCMDQCDYILHEACANAPCRKHNPLHAHPLTLKVVTNGYDYNQGFLKCNACRRGSYGFVYESGQGGGAFRLDLRCALVSEPFKHQDHEHPLFLALKPEEEVVAICHICQEKGALSRARRKLNCIECNYIICFMCATLGHLLWWSPNGDLKIKLIILIIIV